MSTRRRPRQGMLTVTRDSWDPRRHWYPTELAQEEARLRIGEFLLKVIDNEGGTREDEGYRPLPSRFTGKALTDAMGERAQQGLAMEVMRAVADIHSREVLKRELLDPATRERLIPWLAEQRAVVARLTAREVMKGRRGD